MVEMPAVIGFQLGLDDQQQGSPALAARLVVGILLGTLAALPGRVVIGVTEILGIGQLQDEADAAVTVTLWIDRSAAGQRCTPSQIPPQAGIRSGIPEPRHILRPHQPARA